MSNNKSAENHKLSRFEWIDESGLRCPSLVCVADHGDDTVKIKDMPILWTKQILSFDEMYTSNGALNGRKLPRIPGYRPQATARFMERQDLIVDGGPWYALVVAYMPTE